MADDVILAVRNLSLASEDREVLKDITLELLRGEIHAIVGDHNSGKSLIAEIISGAMPFSRGELLFEGTRLRRHTPIRALKMGIETIHQSPKVVTSFSVFENIFLYGVLNRNLTFSDRDALTELAKAKLNAFSLDIDLTIPIDRCSSSDVLIISIVRSLCSQFKLLVVDEVSNKLSASQAESLLNELSFLRQKGASILYFTSNVEEIYQFANRVSFLQKGSIIATEVATKLDKLELVQLSYSHLYSRKELEKSNYELFYLKNYYENIINNMPVPLLLINTQAKIIYANNIFSERYGVSKNEIEGKSIHEILVPNSRENTFFSSDQSKPDFVLKRLDSVVLAIGGAQKRTSLYKIPIYDDEKSPLGSLLYFDVREGGKLIEEHNRRMQTVNRVPFFAHEIRNPLGILNNFLLLIKEKSDSEDIKDYLHRSESEIKRINSIINNLMEEEKATSVSTRNRHVQLWSQVEEAKKLFLPMLNEKKIGMNNDISKDILLRCDEDELKEVLINLLKNAIEATDKYGMIYLTCVVDMQGDKRTLAISVADTGQGIRDEEMQRIFEPYFSTKTGMEKRGLGLVICKDIVTSWGGTITADSPPYRGATFTILLPSDCFELEIAR
ncbi:MAG: ATP-binding protein [Spirochaetia bacterium]|jgi:signal transduction histidine kinase/ABC-type branched-subunit amino acid transport system ATPase component